MKVPYVHSNYPRIEDDDYQTIDKRCIYALNDAIQLFPIICDCCSPNGSGIIDTLRELGYHAFGVPDAFQKNINADIIVSNPPYDRRIVDDIVYAQLDRLGYMGQRVKTVAMLLRNNFSFAKSRWKMFAGNAYYAMEIKMLFRPWWSEDRKAQPIHNYVWHIWSTEKQTKEPIIRFWRENNDK